jgi:PTS system nitrogen regulatory IIA component
MSATGEPGGSELGRLITPDRILLGLNPGGKRQLLQELSTIAGSKLGMPAETILAALQQRERLGTTGIGDGIAIPHAKLEGLAAMTGFLARLVKPIDFEALDGQPIDLVVLLLAPASEGTAHLKALARVARLLRDPQLCARLRDEPSAAGVHALLGEGGGG